ncbi:RNase H family protein [Thermopolyspora sp. NPDC052614]|uniref:ribonuclease HI n=1 Tax=Thermopolyspora sp. NPDC052614 TaxID=3155682 RepID=UPI0034208D57
MNRSLRDFESSLTLLPAEQGRRVQTLREHALTRRDCPRCTRLQELVWLVFDAAYAGDLDAAEKTLTAAEAMAAEGGHDDVCVAPPSDLSGRVAGFDTGGALFGASDAADDRRSGGLGFVTSDGRWGFKRWVKRSATPLLDPSGPSRVLVGELRAVWLMLQAFGEDAERATLLLDSTGAIAYLRAWQSGDVSRLPPGYSLRPRMKADAPTLVMLARRVAELPSLRFEHVRGHRGHPLNEAADSLARIAARNPEDKRERAERIVEAFLKVWHGSGARA